MFPTKALLEHIRCPDIDLGQSCCRVSCPFHHSPSSFDKGAKAHYSIKGNYGETAPAPIASSTNDTQSFEASRPSVTAKPPSVELQPRQRTNVSIGKRKGVDEHDAVQNASETHSKGRPRYSNPLDSILSRQGPQNAYAASKVTHAKQSLQAATTPTIGPNKSSTSSGPSSLSSMQATSSSPSLLGMSSTSIPSTAPTISRSDHLRSSQVPLSVRQASLSTFFTTFTSLYSALLPSSHSDGSTSNFKRFSSTMRQVAHKLACEDALASESKVYRASNTNSTTYRNSVRTSLVSLSRRQKEDRKATDEQSIASLTALGIRTAHKANALCQEQSELSHENEAHLQETLLSYLRSSELIGTEEDVQRKLTEIKEQERGRLDRSRLEGARLLADVHDLVQGNFPIPQTDDGKIILDNTSGVWGDGGTQPDSIGEEKKCERCQALFVVQDLSEKHPLREACNYHWGRKRLEREGIRGPRVQRWTCCGALVDADAAPSMSLSHVAGLLGAGDSRPPTNTSSGCAHGPHVFKEGDAKKLHQREAFFSTNELIGSAPDYQSLGQHQILALDCELVYTTAGMSLARLTVLDEGGHVVLDRLVCPRAAVLDYNTRFSGIRQLPKRSEAHHSLQSVRKALIQLMTPETVLIGHSLENDLNALRLIHVHIADSALLYPHAKGLPFRQSLRNLTQDHLGRLIQTNSAGEGHDAEEDAKAALDLVRVKYRTSDPRRPVMHIEPTRRHEQDLGGRSPAQVTAKVQTSTMTSSSMHSAAPSSKATASLFIPRPRPNNRANKRL